MLALQSRPVPCCEARFTADRRLILNGPAGHFQWGYTSRDDPGLIVDYLCTETELRVQADFYGMIPLFYALDSEQLVIAPTLAEVVALLADRTLDDAAIAFFLRCGHYLNDDTPFRNIRRVPPGAAMVADCSGFSVQRPEARKTETLTGFTKAAAQTHYAELFQNALQPAIDTPDAKICLPLSGGEDSRHILFGLMKSNRPPAVCATVKSVLPGPSDDADTASALAAYFDVHHVLLDEPRQRIKAEIEKNTLIDLCALTHRWALPLNEFTRSSGIDLVYDGIAGDMLSGGRQLTRERMDLFDRQQYERLSENILISENYLSKLLTPERARIWSRELAIARLSRELMRFEGANNPITEFFVDNRTRRAIAPLSWKIFAGPGVVPLAPFLNRRVFQFLRSLPPGFVFDGDFHRNTILEHFKDYENFPFSPKGVQRGNLKKMEVARIVASYLRSLNSGHTAHLNRRYLALKLSQALLVAADGTAISEVLRIPIYLAQLEELRRS